MPVTLTAVTMGHTMGKGDLLFITCFRSEMRSVLALHNSQLSNPSSSFLFQVKRDVESSGRNKPLGLYLACAHPPVPGSVRSLLPGLIYSFTTRKQTLGPICLEHDVEEHSQPTGHRLLEPTRVCEQRHPLHIDPRRDSGLPSRHGME